MRGVWCSLIVALCACGRLDFDTTRTSDDAATDGASGALALVYPRSVVAAVVGVTAIDLAPSISRPDMAFTITPALPAGVTIDAQSGRISGIPAASSEQTFTITAATSQAAVTAPLELLVLPGYVVDTNVEATDATAFDGICATAAGTCSLRAAIQTANEVASRELVLLASSGEYAVTSAFDIVADMVIAGQGAGSTTIRAATLHGLYPALRTSAPYALELRDLAIADFGGDNGGALRVTGGTLDVDRCAFSNNASPTSGGVLFINGGAQATFKRCTFTGNASLGGNGGGWGGVIDGEGASTAIVVTESLATGNTTAWGSFSHITTGTTLRLESSTLYGNVSTVAGTLASPGGIYTIVNSTIAHNANTNTTVDSAGLYLFQVPASYTVTNSIIAFNHDNNGAEYNCNRRDLATSLTSGGGNIFSDGASNCGTYFAASADHLSMDPGLADAMPAAHGGYTNTMLLTAASVALDNGRASACPATDQRDLPRAAGVACDSGAVEMP